MDNITRALVDVTQSRNGNDPQLSLVLAKDQEGDHVMIKSKQEQFSQGNGAGEKVACDKSDIDQPGIETKIDESRLDDLISDVLKTATRVKFNTGAPEIETDIDVQAQNPTIDLADCSMSCLAENLLDEFIRDGLQATARSLKKTADGPSEIRMETDVPDGLIGMHIKSTLDHIVVTESENPASTPKREPVVLDREYPTYTPKCHVTIGTLDKIFIRLGLKKKLRHRVQKSDISWPLPGSLVIRGPDGQLEDGLIAIYVGDLLHYIVTSEKAAAHLTGLSIPVGFSASATVPKGDRDVVKQTKSEGDIPALAVPLPPTSRKSRTFLSRLFGDCRRSKTSLRNNTGHAVRIVA